MIQKGRNGVLETYHWDAGVNSLQKDYLIRQDVMDIFPGRDGHHATREFTGMAPKGLFSS